MVFLVFYGCRLIVTQQVFIVLEVVFSFFAGNAAVEHSVLRAVADTRHAVSAVVAPDRLFVLYEDIVQRTDTRTFPAADTAVFGIEFLCLHLVFRPYGVEGDSDDLFKQEDITGL